MTHRGGKGVKALSITDRNGNIVAFKTVDNAHDLMIITNSGIVIRLPISQISQTGRVTQGVRLINLKDEQKVATVSVIEPEEISEDDVPRGTSDEVIE